MKKVVGHVKKSYYVYALLAVIIAAGIAVGGYIRNIHADDQAYVVADQVVINGKTYTKDNKMQVLMIAPDEAYDEIGLLMGDNQGAIKFTDLLAKAPKNITDGDFRNKIIEYQSFTNNNGLLMKTDYKICYKFPDGSITDSISNISSSDISKKLDGDWKKLKVVVTKSGVEIPYRNIFGAMIFDNYDMDNKMQLSVKKLGDVSMSDLENADLVYISGKSHNSAGINVYNYIKGTNVGSGYKLTENKYGDFSADEALYLLLSYAKGDKKVIFDSTARQDSDNGMNLNKIGILFTAVDPDVFVSDFAKVKVNDNYYYGSKGSIKLQNDKIQLYYKQTSKEIKFSANMFLSSGNNFAVTTQERDGLSNADKERVQDYKDGFPCYNDKGYPYYNANACGTYFVNSSLYVFDGSNSMTSGFTGDSIDITDGTGENYKGTKFSDAYKKNGSDGKLHPADAVEYILGLYNDTDITSIKVLEIEPLGYSKYDNTEGKKAIAKWFGMSDKQYDGIKNAITVDCYSMNAFNGLNEDIRSDYDLVILGAFDDDKYKTDVYRTPYDTNITLKNYSLSGDDVTHKAYEKLYSYVVADMPLVLDDGVYYNLDTIVDSECVNLKDMQITSISKRLMLELSSARSNIAHVNTRYENDNEEQYQQHINMISKSLYYVKKPSVDIGPSIGGNRIADYEETKGSDGKLLPSAGVVENTSLSNIHFSGNLEGSGTYRVKIYVDRNNDSLFSEKYSGEKNELVYYEKNGSDAAKDANGNVLGVQVTGGAFDVSIPLPTTLRGYIKWKVEVIDTATGAVKNSDGAFAIGVSGNNIRTISVLQIENDKESAHIDLTSDDEAFRKTFDRTTSVTGLDIKVDKCKKSEFNQRISDNPDYLSSYSMLVLGFSDNYGNDLSDANMNLSDTANDAIYQYIEDGNSVLYTHDSMSYKNGASDSTASDISEVSRFTQKFKDVIGMKSGLAYTDTLKLKLDSKYTIFSNVSASSKTRNTNRVKQLNSGQITEYPYTLSSQSVMEVSTTHGQYYQLDLETKPDNEDVVVWYTLTGNGGDSDASRYFINSGQDAVNNYYAYSIGNVTYTSAGHSKIETEGDEMELFVNTFVRALLAGNNPPEVEYSSVEPGEGTNTSMAATKVDDNNYAVYYRQRPSTDKLVITYTVTDPDMIANSSQVQETYLYYDVDGDGKYVEGTDVRIGYIDKNGTVFNNKPDDGGVNSGRQYTLTMWNGSYVCNAATMTSDVLSQMKDKMANGTLTLGIVAIDGSKAVGSSTLQIAYRPLFNLN